MRIRNTALYQHFSCVNPDPHGLLEPQQGAVPRAAQKYAGPREAQNAPALEPPKMHRPQTSPKMRWAVCTSLLITCTPLLSTLSTVPGTAGVPTKRKRYLPDLPVYKVHKVKRKLL